ncbi:MAG: chromosome segregation protein SMC [Candidatus Omnitrophica bacterium]|nr:chromosome segregation protein SMC [Candidatus Omnitrophota bacterium]
MYFKKLELFGFKSFADKTTLNFEPGVTAIVGPNGCGKSNIADAIRWVLGEQSARLLRGSHMEDIIFNGTSQRQALSMSEVSLTLSGCSPVLPSEYDEVTVTRRIFRSGESQYFLNKTQVRLKDISELFMGTGVGTRAYSMIEQGKIDLILSSKPEDRRFIFEEAAGITKYKSKKKETLRKLEQTEANLIRVNDIVKEVKRQINSIDRQARKAHRYKERFDQLKDLELKISGIKYESITEQLSQTGEYLNSLRQKESEQISLSSKSGDDTNHLRVESESVEDRLSRVREEQVEIEKEIDRYGSRINMDEERIQELGSRHESVGLEIEELNKKIDESSGTIEGLNSNVSDAESILGQKKDELNLRQSKLDELQDRITRDKEQLERSKIEVIDIAQNQTRIKNDLIKISADMANLNSRLRRLKSEEAASSTELTALDDKLNTSSEALKAALEAVEDIIRQRHDLEDQLRHREDERLTLTERLNSQKECLTVASSKLEFLEELRRKYEGFTAGVKELINLKNTNPAAYQGIQGLVYDVIEVEPGYEAALESAFGEWLQAIIVDSSEEVKRLSDYLDEHDLGRAWFLSVENIRLLNNESIAGLQDREGITAKVTDFIRTPDQYKQVINWLLKDTYLVDSIDQALKITASVPETDKCRFVTREGRIIYKGSLVWSGSKKVSPEGGLIARQALIRGLKQEVEVLNKEVALKETEFKDLSDRIQSINQQLIKMRHDLDEKRLDVTQKQTAQTRLESEHKKLKDELELTQLEISELQEQLAQNTGEQEQLEARLRRIEESHNNIQTLMTNTQNDINQMSIEREQVLMAIGEFRAEVSSSQEKLNRYLSSKDIYQKNLDEYRQSAQARSEQLSQFDTTVERLKSEIIQSKTRLDELAEKKIRTTGSLNEVLEKRTGINNQLKNEEDLRQQKQDELEKIRRQLYEHQEKNTELSFKAQRIQERMEETYKVDIRDMELNIPSDFNKEQACLSIEELKSKLDKFGAVNVAAIEEHQELTERYEFLTTHQQDLAQARESLLKVIAKINRTTRKLFMETFTQIQTTFREFFKQLFGGGNADLVLVDQQDILETGIEIMARPPGKKIQAISLLSGGERSMTAIALLFSIFKVKPSPFCVLDEMDAALDEANVDRFSRVLTDFVKMSQFIIITHNKKTIGTADVMYGVTMAEFGISRIVSVKLKQGEDEDSQEDLVSEQEQPAEDETSGQENIEESQAEPLEITQEEEQFLSNETQDQEKIEDHEPATEEKVDPPL